MNCAFYLKLRPHENQFVWKLNQTQKVEQFWLGVDSPYFLADKSSIFENLCCLEIETSVLKLRLVNTKFAKQTNKQAKYAMVNFGIRKLAKGKN